jgi:hypothetical protein
MGISRKSQVRLQAWHPISRYVFPVSNHGKTIMTKIVLALTLSAAMLAGTPISALDEDPKEKDRCELKQDATELTVACQKGLRKNAAPLNELTRRAFYRNAEGPIVRAAPGGAPT